MKEKHSSITSITIYLTCSLFDLPFICIFLLSKHTAAEGETCKQQLGGTMLTWSQQLMETRLWYSESFTRILDKHHRPDIFAAGCLPPSHRASWRQMGFLSAGSILEQLAQCTSHMPPVLRETGMPNNLLCILPNITGFLLYSTNTIMILKMKYL